MDVADGNPDVLSVSPSSDQSVTRYLDGTEIREANFQVYLKAIVNQDFDRIQNTQLIDKMMSWINRQGKQRNFPEIVSDMGRTCTEISAANGMFYQNDGSGEGLYMLQVKMRYTVKGR